MEPSEKSKLRNGEVIDAEHENTEDEVVDESKYTTASGATAAERDISEVNSLRCLQINCFIFVNV